MDFSQESELQRIMTSEGNPRSSGLNSMSSHHNLLKGKGQRFKDKNPKFTLYTITQGNGNRYVSYPNYLITHDAYCLRK